MARGLGVQSPYLQAFPSITLGSFGVSPLDMAAAYSTIANYGTRNDTYLIDRIENSDGTVIYRHDPRSEEVLSAAIASAVVETLQDAVAGGTGTRARIGRPQGGKTGTATESVDVWFVGFVPQFTTAVWVGYPDEARTLQGFTVWNDLEQEQKFYSSQATGGQLAAPIWAQFMLDVTAGLPVEDFPQPPTASSVYFQTPFTTAPDVSGLSVDEIIEAVYASGLRPVFDDVPSPEPLGTIVGQDPLPGTILRESRQVVIEVSTGVPADVPLPDLTGLPSSAIAQEFEQFRLEHGIRVAWIVRHVTVADPAGWNRVVATTPPPGALVTEDETITVIVGTRP
jgi:membrane peptidoglycan carboxypeptidase